MKKLFLISASLAVIASSAFIAQAAEKAAVSAQPPKGEEGMHSGKHKGGMLAQMDGNSDGVISKEEFIAHATKRFMEADANNDGNVTEEEMKSHHEAEKAKREQHKKEMEAMQDKRFSEMDKDGDGKISKEEMKNFRGGMKGKEADAPEGTPEAE